MKPYTPKEGQTAMQAQPRPGAYLLDSTRQHCDYWVKGGRDHPDRATAILALEQAVNAWKNAAYDFAEKLHWSGYLDPHGKAPVSENGEQAGDITSLEDAKADETGVERFAKAMNFKLLEKRLAGYSGWNNDCTTAHLEGLLTRHIDKPWDGRNLVDIANFCMMLWNREHPNG